VVSGDASLRRRLKLKNHTAEAGGVWVREAVTQAEIEAPHG